MNQLKMFTIAEANQLLPRLTVLLKELQQKRDIISALEVEIDVLELVAVKDDGGVAPSLTPKVDEYTRTVSRFYKIIDEVHEQGCFLKDVDTGLIDFYTVQNGRVVYLCWKLGEPEVGYWHEIGRGFTSRQPLA